MSNPRTGDADIAEVHARRGFWRPAKRVVAALNAFQGRHSPIGVAPFFDPAGFAFTAALEGAWERIDRELETVLMERQRLPAFHELSPDQARISRGDSWKTYPFYVFGHRVHASCARCPETAALLDGLAGLQNAWFSILAPGYHIPPHHGPTRMLLRVHLGLRVPRAAERCWIRVDDEVRHWERGRVIVFDDTFEHEVHNDTDEERVVLFLDFDRPMDWAGRALSAALLPLIRRGPWVREPLARLAAADWNEGTSAR